MVVTECGGLIIELEDDVAIVRSKDGGEGAVVVRLEGKQSPIAEAIEAYKRIVARKRLIRETGRWQYDKSN